MTIHLQINITEGILALAAGVYTLDSRFCLNICAVLATKKIHGSQTG